MFETDSRAKSIFGIRDRMHTAPVMLNNFFEFLAGKTSIDKHCK